MCIKPAKMAKTDLESRLKSAKEFIKNHKASCFLTGVALHVGNIYLGYYKAFQHIGEGDYKTAAIDYGLSHLFSIPGTILMVASGFYEYKQLFGRKKKS